MAELKPYSFGDNIENKEDTSKLLERHPCSVNVTEVLTTQILQHYDKIKAVENGLKELLASQEECICGLSEENARFDDAKKNLNFNVMFDQISFYTKKLNHLRSCMTSIDDRMARLKHRSKIIKEQQERRVRGRREAKEREEELERLLTAKPVWEVNKSPLDKTDT